MRALGERCGQSAGQQQNSAADLTELTVYLLRVTVVDSCVHLASNDKKLLLTLWKTLVFSA